MPGAVGHGGTVGLGFRGWGEFSGGTVLLQGQKTLRAFGACESHLLEHYLRGKFFSAPSAQASITTANVAQKVPNIRVGGHSRIHSRRRCRRGIFAHGVAPSTW